MLLKGQKTEFEIKWEELNRCVEESKLRANLK